MNDEARYLEGGTEADWLEGRTEQDRHADYGRWPTCRKCGGILIAAWPDNHLAHRIARKRAEHNDGDPHA